MKHKEKIRCRFLPVVPCVRAIAYLLALLLSFIFAQSVPSAFSHSVFRFVIFFAPISIICLIVSVFFIHVETDGDISVTRGGRAKISVLIRNNSIIPISCVKASILLPDENGRRALGREMIGMALLPMSGAIAELETCYFRIGVFDVGADEIFVYDFLRLFRIRKRVRAVSSVTVLPKSLKPFYLMPYGTEDDGASEQVLEHTVSYDYGDVREYRPGDSMKRMHWKLSTKSEELQVKKYISRSENSVYIFCDRKFGLERYGTSMPVICEAEDRVIEEALSVASEFSEKGEKGILAVRENDGTVFSHTFFSDISELSRSLLNIDRGEAELDVDAYTENVTKTVYVLPFTHHEQGIDVFELLKKYPIGSFLVYLCNMSSLIPEEKRDEYKKVLERFVSVLIQNAIPFILCDRKEGNE